MSNGHTDKQTDTWTYVPAWHSHTGPNRDINDMEKFFLNSVRKITMFIFLFV